jgi:hypothetical protein
MWEPTLPLLVTLQMQSTFRWIQFGLVAGVRGGVLSAESDVQLELQGRYDEALAMMEDCTELRKSKRGSDHLHTTSLVETLNKWYIEKASS